MVGEVFAPLVCAAVKVRSSFLLRSRSSRGAVRFVGGCLPRSLGSGFARSSLCCVLSIVISCCASDKYLSMRPSRRKCVGVSRSRVIGCVIGRTGGSKVKPCSPSSMFFMIRKRVRCKGSLKRISWRRDLVVGWGVHVSV